MKKILIAEDSPTILEIVKNILEQEGYSVITAIDGLEALAKAKKESPDLIILDLMLPKIDGYKVCGMLKFDKNFSRIPIMILTARAGEEDKKMAADVKADEYIVKPFEQEVFLPKVKKLLKEDSRWIR
jgi:two-component system alkaline phosphatase synthesis response regulator PhoP